MGQVVFLFSNSLFNATLCYDKEFYFLDKVFFLHLYAGCGYFMWVFSVSLVVVVQSW